MKLRAAGYALAGVISLVDREEGGRQNVEAAGLVLRALFTRSEFPR
jgi:orotate phosphoribosyltransferase